jgi:hypothetical protein
VISFENTLGIKEVEQEQQTLVKQACPSILVHQKEMFSHGFHDPMTCYMENSNNQNLSLRMVCKLIDEYNGQ